VNVNDKQGLTFSVALKSFLRQDPDIIMVGEIRDIETGEIAIKAAQTGHMVLSTLHTNDAPTTLTRLMNMGIAPFNIASSVILITAQRLARKLCSCKKPVDIPEEALKRAGFRDEDLDGTWQAVWSRRLRPVQKYRLQGTASGIYQVMPITEEMQRIIMKNGTAIDLADQATRRRQGPAPVGAHQGQARHHVARGSRVRDQRVGGTPWQRSPRRTSRSRSSTTTPGPARTRPARW
jgi:type IV pilus assembly protein PilB